MEVNPKIPIKAWEKDQKPDEKKEGAVASSTPSSWTAARGESLETQSKDVAGGKTPSSSSSQKLPSSNGLLSYLVYLEDCERTMEELKYFGFNSLSLDSFYISPLVLSFYMLCYFFFF
jgi:hypothetical protein